MPRRRSLAFALLLVAAASPGCAGDERARDVPSEVVARGEALYQTHCASCHGPDGEGQPDWKQRGDDGVYPAPPHDSSGHTWHHSDADLIEIIRLGGQAVYGSDALPSGMPAFGHVLSDEEIEAVLEFIKTYWGDEERAYQEQLNERR